MNVYDATVELKFNTFGKYRGESVKDILRSW